MTPENDAQQVDDLFEAGTSQKLDEASGHAANHDKDGKKDDKGSGDTETVLTPEELIDQLKKQAADEKAARIEAEGRAKALETERNKATTTAQDAVMQTINTQEQKLESDLTAAQKDYADLRRQYKEAFNGGDSDKLDEINDQMLSKKVTITKLEDNKIGLTQYKERYENQRKAATENQGDVDPDLAAIGYNNPSPAIRNWIAKNPNFKTDAVFRKQCERAHYAALADDVAPDSKEYFEFIEKKVGLRKDDGGDNTATQQNDAPPAKKTERTSVGAPPSRDSGSNSSSGNGRFKKLSAEEAESAENSGMSPEEYWDSKHLAAHEFSKKYGYSNQP